MKKTILTILLTLGMAFCATGTSYASLFYLFADTSGDGYKDTLIGSMNSYNGTLTGKKNYNYFSASGHPVKGPNPDKNKVKFFIYERTTNGHQFLNVIGGKDTKGPNKKRSYSVDFTITGSDLDPKVAKGDEGKEFNETGADFFHGDWTFKKNSDGGVIGGLLGNWEAKIVINNTFADDHVFASKGSENWDVDSYSDKSGFNTFFISQSDQLPQAAVPEPATMLLFAGGLAGGFVRRKFKK